MLTLLGKHDWGSMWFEAFMATVCNNILGWWAVPGVNIRCFGYCLYLRHQGPLYVVSTCCKAVLMTKYGAELIVSSLDDGDMCETSDTDFIFTGLITRTGILQCTCGVMKWLLWHRRERFLFGPFSPLLSSHTDPENVRVLLLILLMPILLLPTSLPECYVNWVCWWRLQRNQGHRETSFCCSCGKDSVFLRGLS
jgi:hypothetical protein